MANYASTNICEIDFSNLIFHEQIGEGGEGTVYRVTFKIPHGGFTQAAAKTVRSSDVDMKEVGILGRLEHPHIVPLLGFCSKAPLNMLILELAPHGSLHDYLSMTGLTHNLFTEWVKQVALAVQYLHDSNIIHR